MAAVRQWLNRRFRLVVGIPLLLVVVGIGVQALVGIGDPDSYAIQGAAWVAYLIAVVGLAESGGGAKPRRSRRGGRARGGTPDQNDPADGEPASGDASGEGDSGTDETDAPGQGGGDSDSTDKPRQKTQKAQKSRKPRRAKQQAAPGSSTTRRRSPRKSPRR